MTKLGIIGLGYIGRIHYQASRSIEGVQVVAVATSRADEARQLCGADVHIYANYPDLLQHDQLDAVIICLPTFLHDQYALAAAERGLHILCEKPFAMDLIAAHSMLESARRNKVIMMVAQVLRFWRPYVRIKQLVDEGAVGAIHAVTAWRLAKYPPWSKWFRDPRKSGGALLDLQVHDVDFVYWLLGLPDEAYSAGIQSGTGSWDQASTTLRYPNAVASIESSCLAPGSWPFTCGIRVSGTDGCLEYTFRVAGNVEQREKAVSKLVMYDNDDSVTEPEIPSEDMYVAQLRYFVECVAHKQCPSLCPPEETLEVMRIMSACQQSLSTRIPVRL